MVSLAGLRRSEGERGGEGACGCEKNKRERKRHVLEIREGRETSREGGREGGKEEAHIHTRTYPAPPNATSAS
jgi:hypothetical protein